MRSCCHLRANSCCQRASEDHEAILPPEQSKYKNKIIKILFPLTFFCTLVGITFLFWPIESKRRVDEEVSILFIIGVLFTGVAGTAALLSIFIVCYLHITTFERKRLPFYAIDYSRQTNEPQEVHKSPLSASKVRPQVDVIQPATNTKPAKWHKHTNSLPTHEEIITEAKDDSEQIIAPKVKSQPTGIDNGAATVFADVHRSLSADSAAHATASVKVTYNNNKRNTPVGKLPPLSPRLEDSEITHL